MKVTIGKAKRDDAKTIAKIIKEANTEVAQKLGLSNENVPKHSSNCTSEWIEEDLNRGVEYFVASINKKIVGCIAFEKPSENLAYLNRLAVLPEFQSKGIGKKLVNFHLQYSKENEIKNVSIGIINEHTELKNWYIKLGFTETEIKRFEHLPFTVCLMNIKI